MATTESILNIRKEGLKVLDHGSDPDITTVADLAKLLSECLHTCFRNAIKKITECGHSKEVAEFTVLRCGPFYGSKDIVSSIVDRALYCLRNEGCHDAALYTFEDLNSMVSYMLLEMVTMLREVKPSLSVHEALWTLLICDLSVVDASDAEMDPQRFSIGCPKTIEEEGTPVKPETETPSQDKETTASNVIKPPLMYGERIEKKCQCCKSPCSGHKRDPLGQKVFHFEKSYKGRNSKSTIKAKLAIRGDLFLDKKQSSPSFLSTDTKNSTSTLKESGDKPKVAPKPEALRREPSKTVDYYLAGIAYDETRGEHVPQDEKDEMILAAVSQLQMLQKELQIWDDWVNVKVMQVAKRLSLDRPELNKLKAEKEAADKLKKDKQAMQVSTTKKLAEIRASLTSTKCQIQIANTTIVRLKSENSVLKQKRQVAENQSLLQAKILDEALFKEQEALKKSESFGSEKNLLEEDLKSLKLLVGRKQQHLEKAKLLLKQTETRLAKEERETVKLLDQALSIRNKRERLEALAKRKDETTTKEAEKEFKKYEIEIKRIQYFIAALKLEAEAKAIAAMHKAVNLQSSEGTSWLNVSRKDFTHLECVLCLSEETTVVFVPCGHQVLCAECNVIHAKKGMKECPSCRTPIQKRISARFAES